MGCVGELSFQMQGRKEEEEEEEEKMGLFFGLKLWMFYIYSMEDYFTRVCVKWPEICEVTDVGGEDDRLRSRLDMI